MEEPLKLWRIPGVEIFTTSGFSQGEYEPDDIRQVVRNFYKLGKYVKALLNPPVGIGHDDDQNVLKTLLESDSRLAPWLTGATLDGDDAPAAGWVTGLRIEDNPDGGVTLLADFEDVPDPIAQLIQVKAYRRVSAEIYDDFPDGDGNRWGYALRRVSLCGWQPPVNKGMADMPMPVAQFAEPRRIRATSRRVLKPGVYLCYSEFPTMNRLLMLAALTKKGFTLPDVVSDEELKGLYKKYAEPPVTPPAVPPVPPAAKMDEGPTRDQMIAEMQAAGQDAAQLASLDDATLVQMYQQWKMQTTQPANPAAAAMGEMKKYAEEVRQLVTSLKTMFSDANIAMGGIKKHAEAVAKQSKDAKINAIRNELVGAKSGLAHCTPAEFDAVHRDTLATLDDATVQKFSEGGKDYTITPFDNYVRKLKSLPPKKVFGEKIIDPADSQVPAAEAEVAVVRRYAEENEKGLKSFGYTVDQYVDQFAKLREKSPSLTAQKYIGQSA